MIHKIHYNKYHLNIHKIHYNKYHLNIHKIHYNKYHLNVHKIHYNKYHLNVHKILQNKYHLNVHKIHYNKYHHVINDDKKNIFFVLSTTNFTKETKHFFNFIIKRSKHITKKVFYICKEINNVISNFRYNIIIYPLYKCRYF